MPPKLRSRAPKKAIAKKPTAKKQTAATRKTTEQKKVVQRYADEVRFWFRQFSEHALFMSKMLKANKNKITLSAKQLQTVLKPLKAKETIFADLYAKGLKPDRADLTKQLATVAFDVVELGGLIESVKPHVKNVPCLTSLAEHMLEEGQYVLDFVFRYEKMRKPEIKFWCREQIENLEYAACQIPVLIEKDTGAAVPAWLKKAFKDGAALASKFKALEKMAVTNKSIETFRTLSEQHSMAVRAVVARVPDIPILPATRQDLCAMLEHESNESSWALERSLCKCE